MNNNLIGVVIDLGHGGTDRVAEILDAYGNNPNVVVVSNHPNAGGGEFSYH